MSDVKPKYEAVREGVPQAEVVAISDTGRIAILPRVQRRDSDGELFANIRVVHGYEGRDLAGQPTVKPQRYNSTVELPVGLTEKDFQELWKAYKKVSDGVQSMK